MMQENLWRSRLDERLVAKPVGTYRFIGEYSLDKTLMGIIVNIL